MLQNTPSAMEPSVPFNPFEHARFVVDDDRQPNAGAMPAAQVEISMEELMADH